MDLKAETKKRTEEAEELMRPCLCPEGDFQETVLSAMNYSLQAGGKRLRPILMREAYRLFSDQETDALYKLMAAIEMVHTYSLVHDDLPAMDNDFLRRGKPSTHAKYGEAMGILAGDGLLTYAFETGLSAFAAERDHPERVGDALRILAEKAGPFGMLGGQAVDVEGEKDGTIPMTKGRLTFIYEKKTACLLEAALMMGAVLAGAPRSKVSSLERIGSLIGLAFQIEDDILDVTGDEGEVGKTIHQDEANGKATYVSLYGLGPARTRVRELTDEAVSVLDAFPEKDPYLRALLLSLVDRSR